MINFILTIFLLIRKKKAHDQSFVSFSFNLNLKYIFSLKVWGCSLFGPLCIKIFILALHVRFCYHIDTAKWKLSNLRVNLALNGQITSADGEQGQYENIIKYDGLKMKILKHKGPKWKQPQT